jgi:hypothetical protein
MIDLNTAREVVVMFIEQMGVDVDLPALTSQLGNVMPPPPMANTGSAGPNSAHQNSGGAASGSGRGTNMATPKVKGTGSNIKEAGAATEETDDASVDNLLAQIESLSHESI